jgi:hypothetical protein
MNFCGMDQRNVGAFHCGECVKDVVLLEGDDDIETFLNTEKQLSPVLTLSSSNEHPTTSRETTTITRLRGNNTSSSVDEHPNFIKPVAQVALDNIQQTIEDITLRDSKSVFVSDVVNVDDLCVEEDEEEERDEASNYDTRDDCDDRSQQYDGATTRNKVTPYAKHGDIPPVPYTPISCRDNSSSLSMGLTSSPCLLNPLDMSEWTETREGIELMGRQELLCPILSDIHSTTTSPSHEALLLRLEQGFRVHRMNGISNTDTAINKDQRLGPDTATATATATTNPLISIFLHPDRSRICFGSANYGTMVEIQRRQRALRTRSRLVQQQQQQQHRHNPHRSQSNNSKLWMEIFVTDILRLEIGGQNTKSFSIITCTPESGYIVDHTFEATCVIDREVVVSTLLLLLDQVHFHSRPELRQNEKSCFENDDAIFDWIEGSNGGTMDKPIVCSPSLDEPMELNHLHSDEQPIINCSQSVETERIQNRFHYISNQQRQQPLSTYSTSTMLTTTDTYEAENGDVINLEDISMSDSNVSRVLGQWSRRTSSSLCLRQQKSWGASEELEDTVRLDCKASASSSTQIFGGNSSNIANNISQAVWCSGDTCALALNDIAETCTGIFALKQNDSLCSPVLGVEQRVAVEEFIATALGTPTEVYSYLTDGGDIWNSTTATIPAAKHGKIRRNRATILNAQAARLRALRNEMTFAAALKQSKEKMQFVQTVQSFDDAYNRTGTKKLRAATEAANRLHTSPLLQSIVGNMRMHDVEGNTKLDDDTSHVVYYDSDPEDSRPHNADKGPRKMVQSNTPRKGIGDDNSVTTQPKNLVSLDEVVAPMKISKKLDEETIVEIVQVHFENSDRKLCLHV